MISYSIKVKTKFHKKNFTGNYNYEEGRTHQPE